MWIWNIILSYLSIFNTILVAFIELSALSVALVRSPIISLLSLIGLFFSSILWLLLHDVQFLAYIYLIVYLGAIAILFLFVLMLMNINQLFNDFYRTQFKEKGSDVLFSIIVLGTSVQLFKFLIPNFFYYDENLLNNTWNIRDILICGQYLYTTESFVFIASSVLLLVAMVGAIICAKSTTELSTLTLKNSITDTKQVFDSKLLKKS